MSDNPSTGREEISRKERLLLVDDDDAFRDRLGRALVRHGFEVTLCSDARQAGKAANHSDATHAVIDLRMPHVGGLEVLTDILKVKPGLRAVILSGYGNMASAMEAVRRGAFDFLIKPCETEALVRTLRGGRPFSAYLPEAAASLERLEWEHIHRVLADQHDNISQTARILGIDRRSLQRKLAKRSPLPDQNMPR